jgi:formylmethanofuran dehydrogenase subunit C
MLRLTLLQPPAVPLEVVDGLCPHQFRGLRPHEVPYKTVYHGNRREQLGDWFRVEGDASDGEVRVAGDCSRVKGIAAGMTVGRMVVEGNVGMHAAAGMRGGVLEVHGDAGDWLGAEMSGGLIRVAGSAGHQVGAAYRGGRRGMTGGTIHIRGSAGDEVGLLMRRGLIAVEGGVGEFAAASMIAGTVVVTGAVGKATGAGMKRGTVLILGDEPELGPGFRFSCEYAPAFLDLLLGDLRRLGYDPGKARDHRPVLCFRGDLVNGGAGELLIAPTRVGGC